MTNTEGKGGSDGDSLIRFGNEADSIANATTVLKKRHHDIEAKAERARKIQKEKEQAKKAIRPRGPKSAESIIKQARRNYIDRRRVKRQAKLDKPKLKKEVSQSKVILVVRNSEKHKSKGSRSILRDWRIIGHYTAVFLANNKDTLAKLKEVEPFVFYGHPSASLVRSLITKRGYVKPIINAEESGASVESKKAPKEEQEGDKMKDIDADSDGEDSDENQTEEKKKEGQPSADKEPILLTDNLIVETHLGHHGILSVDDLVHEVFMGGPGFTEITQALVPFKLENLRKNDGISAAIRTGYQGALSEVLSKIV